MALSPAAEARYAIDNGIPKEQISEAARQVYDQVRAEMAAREGEPPTITGPVIPARSSPEVRARILQMIKAANPKYAKPFEQNRMAPASFVGTDSWAEYGQVVLQMAILDTLLSIEELLFERRTDTQPE